MDNNRIPCNSGSTKGRHPVMDNSVSNQTYNLKSKSQVDQPLVTSMFRIDSCGVNREEHCYQYEDGDSCFTYSLDNHAISCRQMHHANTSIPKDSPEFLYLSHQLWVTELKNRNPTPPGMVLALFAFGLCDCSRCSTNKWIDTLKLEPVVLEFELKCEKTIVKERWTFFPACTSDFDVTKHLRQNNKHILYYCIVQLSSKVFQTRLCEPLDANNQQETNAIGKTDAFGCPPIIKILKCEKRAGKVRANVEENEMLIKTLYYRQTKSDLVIVSSEGKVFHIHRDILADRSKVIKTIFFNKGTAVDPEIKILEDGKWKWHLCETEVILEIFLKYIYRLIEDISLTLDFEVTAGLFRLAYRFRIQHLVESTVTILLKNVTDSNWVIAKDLLELYTLVLPESSIELVVRLRVRIFAALKRRITSKTDKRKRPGSGDGELDAVVDKILSLKRDVLKELLKELFNE